MMSNNLSTRIAKVFALDAECKNWSQQDLYKIIKRHNLHPETKDVITVIESHEEACSIIREMMEQMKGMRKELKLINTYKMVPQVNDFALRVQYAQETETNRIAQRALSQTAWIEEVL